MELKEKPRCTWCLKDELYMSYHDQEWGVPSHDDRHLFEHLILETFQAGLSWYTILRKREHFRKVMDAFNPLVMAEYGEDKINQLMNDPGIIRNKAKILASIQNAKAFLRIVEKEGSFDQYIWSFTEGKTLIYRPGDMKLYPSQSPLSKTISADLKKRGFSFTGPVGIHAYLQAVGILDEHMAHCWKASF